MGVPLYRLPARAEARGRFGLSEAGPVVASLGEMSPHKRMDVALRALVRTRERHPDLTYIVAGNDSPGLNLDRQVRMLGLDGAVRRLGYIAEASVPDLLAAADLVVNLRYPTAGETSASLLRILAAEQAVVVTRAGSMAEMPPDACAMVAPDAVEEELLAEVIDRLIDDRPLRDKMAANARAYVEREHTLPISAAAYLRVLGRMLGRELSAPTLGARDHRRSRRRTLARRPRRGFDRPRPARRPAVRRGRRRDRRPAPGPLAGHGARGRRRAGRTQPGTPPAVAARNREPDSGEQMRKDR